MKVRKTKKNNNNKITLGFLGAIILLIVITINSNVGALPPYGEDPYQCHSQGGYFIETENSLISDIEKGETFNLEISGSGSGVQIHVISGARHNDLFNLTTPNIISDNSEFDTNMALNEITVNLEITVPDEDGPYILMILARSPDINKPDFAFLEFEVNVGEVSVWQKIGNFLRNEILNHMNIYIGGTAVFCLALGTLLYEIDNQKFTKTHGILATTAFVLTTINVFFILQPTFATIGTFVEKPSGIDWGHLIHIITGIIGYVAGIVAVITGLSGIRTKKPGYIALIFWTFNFIYGISPFGWGIGL
ncbi:MAG: hypothetical protein ACTSRK_18680 [Promethearchaeota archaeon]